MHNPSAAPAPMPRQPFLGFDLLACPTAEFLDWLLVHAATPSAPVRIGYLNAAQVNLAFADPGFAANLRRFEALYADGQAIVWAARWLGAPIAERINAGDFTRDFIRELARRGLRLALVGGRPAAGGSSLGPVPGEGSGAGAAIPAEADLAAAQFRQWAPGIDIVLTHHGYLDAAHRSALAARIDAADPHVVLLGAGAPRQEAWALEFSRAACKPRVWWCVGALFEYYAGTRRRAPVWMRRAGLEWAFRLAMEPGRMWRRYLVGNPSFVWRVLRRRPPSA